MQRDATAYDRVLEALRKAVPSVKANERQATANCPAHDDQHPSLGVTRIEGSVLICCRSQGCHIDDILSALKLIRSDLYDDPAGATYRYDDGRMVHRTPDKQFRQSGNTAGRALYRLAQVKAAVAEGQPVYIVEGEKDVHALESLGAVATTSPMGASNWHRVDPEPLSGAHVIIIPDRDGAGQTYAGAVATSLEPIAATVEVRLPKHGKDAADHVAAGLGLDDFEPAEVPVSMNGDSEHRSIAYVSFRDLFTKPREPVRWYASPVVAAGRVTTIYSPGKAGKSLIAMEIAAAVSTGMPVLGSPAGEPVQVLYIDQEMMPEDWHERLEDMGYTATDADILDQRLHLAQLQSWPPLDTFIGGASVFAEVERFGAEVVIIDTASKVISGKENDNDTHADFYRNTIVPLKRAGCGVLVLDHTGKDIERGARGGSAKTDNVDLAFELLTRGRDLLSLRCSHQRFRDAALEAALVLHRLEAPLRHELERQERDPNRPPGVRPTHIMEKVSRYVESNPDISTNGITTAKLGKHDFVRLAIELLSNERYMLIQQGPNNAQIHRIITPYREADE